MQKIVCAGVASLFLFVAGCEERRSSTGGEPRAVAATSKPAASADHEHDHEHESDAPDCAGMHGGARLLNDKLTTRVGPGGKKIVHAGHPFSKDALSVKVADLLASPETHEGKKVRIEGNISTMCVKGRSWFAVVADDKSGAFVRVQTYPVFLVPADSTGKLARAEGTVELVEISEQMARHYARTHQMGDPEAIKGPQKRAVLRATGAEFI